MNEASTEWLTAAECASRTGLTVRALRVYENYGLIAPGRSAAGWRRYGARELLKLNEIGLLKVLGLTLNQIRDLTRRPLLPNLRQLLELQLGAWKDRRAEAERGQAVAEAALRIKDRRPMMGSEEALRRMLDAGRAGNPNYDRMSPEFAHFTRGQLPYWQIVGQYFGAIVSIEFLRVSDQGWDIYEVQHENDVHQYRIALGDDGEVYGFSEASAAADKRALV